MNHQHIETDVLARYLSDESPVHEKVEVERWIAANDQNRKKFNTYKRIWDSSFTRPELNEDLFDAGVDWDKLNQQIHQQSVTPAEKNRNGFSAYNIARPSSVYAWMRVAAIFFVVTLMGVLAYSNWDSVKPSAEKPALREITTAVGQRVNLTLSDGTKVLLNADSKIKLPNVFDAHRREVFLEGQAYFEVAKNPEKPFVIHSGKGQTRVLGTKFSVRAYPSDREITVAVKEGRVSFTANNNTGNEQTILHKRELARYDLNNRQLTTEKIDDLGLYLGWVNGYLEFKNTAMIQVARELERRYGVSITFENKDIKRKVVTARLKSRSIKNVLDTISMSLDINYKIDGDHVVFM